MVTATANFPRPASEKNKDNHMNKTTFFDLYRRYHLAALALFRLGIVSSIHDYDKHTNPNR